MMEIFHIETWRNQNENLMKGTYKEIRSFIEMTTKTLINLESERGIFIYRMK